MIFETIVDGVDAAFRVSMRMQSLIAPRRDVTTFFGANMTCDLRDFIQRRIAFFKIYEPNLTYLMKRRVRAGDTFVDLGANIGYFSLLAASLVGRSGNVLAIEADPATYRTLRANLQRNGCAGVDARNVAVTERACTIEVVPRQAHNLGANAVRVAANGGGAVPGRPIMELLGERAPDVHFIKIDIEGSEAPVLAELLAHASALAPRLTIVAELSPPSAAYVTRFREAGFAVSALPNSYRIGYLLVREYLRRSGEHEFAELIAVDDYRPEFSDYVFERGT